MVIAEHASIDLIIDPRYLGISRTDDAVWVTRAVARGAPSAADC
jgi:hypothetical protein